MFCKENYVNFRALSHAVLVRDQLMDLCERAGIQQSSCGKDFSQVRKCLLSGLFNNVATHARDKLYVMVKPTII
jgi:ATP-dependent RNA helicase DHX33